MKERDPSVHGQIESHNTNLQAIDLNQSCSGQAHSNKLGTVMGMKKRSLDVITQYSVFHLLFVRATLD